MPRPDPDHADGGRLLATALLYAVQGWPVFWLGPGKAPVANCHACRTAGPEHDPQACPCLTCHGFYAATTDLARIITMAARVPGGMLAIRTGTTSGLVVIDVDPDHGGTASLAPLDEVQLLPGTLQVHTGSGGVHLYYAHPGGQIRSGSRLLGPGIDVKADGGYVVAPPSVHPVTGGRYRWFADDRHDHPPTPLHPTLTQQLCKPDHQSVPVPALVPVVPPQVSGLFRPPCDPRGRLAGLVATVLGAPVGARNDRLNWAAYTAAGVVAAGEVAEPVITAALADAAAEVGLPTREAAATIASGLRAGRMPAS